jgi:hypothetical protein
MKYEYEIYNAAGDCCCGGNTYDFPRCDKCKGKPATVRQARALSAPTDRLREALERRALVRAAANDDYAPPDPYATPLAKLREENATPESRFEDRYKAEWIMDLAREYDAAVPPRPDPLPDRPLASYAPPDPYADLHKETK